MRVDRRCERAGMWGRWMPLLTTMMMVTLLSIAGSGQTLARRGWAGSGITVAPWWKGAVFYQLDPRSLHEAPTNEPDANDESAISGLVSRLEFVQSLGVDAIVLSPAPIEPAALLAAAEQNAVDLAGSNEALDRLMQEAGRRKLRVLVDLPMSSAQSGEELAKLARFWLSRGAAGLRVRLLADASGSALTDNQRRNRLLELRHLCASYAGQRVLLWDGGERGAEELPAREVVVQDRRGGGRLRAQSAREADLAQMIVNRRMGFPAMFDAAELRQSLRSAAGATRPGEAAPVLMTDSSDRSHSFDRYADGQHDREIAKVMAAVLLLTRGSALLLAGQELGGAGESSPASVATAEADRDSLLNWYRQLGALRHERAELRDGAMEVMPALEQEVLVWIRRAKQGGRMGAAVIVVANFSAQARVISIETELRRMGILQGRGMLHPLLTSSANAEQAGSASGIPLQPFGVYVGELRAQPGLETVVLPARRSRRRSR